MIESATRVIFQDFHKHHSKAMASPWCPCRSGGGAFAVGSSFGFHLPLKASKIARNQRRESKLQAHSDLSLWCQPGEIA